MANANTVTTLDAVHEGIVSAIAAQFPDLATVEAYRLDRKNLPVPACLVELTEMDALPDDDPGTEQQAVNARFEARLVIGFRQGNSNPKLQIRKLAAAVAAFVRAKRWGCPIGAAEVLGAYPDDFDPELDQYECWRVEWQQLIYLGDTVWNDEGVTPSRVFAGVSPDIGAGNEPAYTELTAPEGQA
jgi:hypothetical protein